MSRHLLSTVLGLTPRVIAWLALAAVALPFAPGPATPARADEPIVRDHRDPDARVQVVVKSVYIRDEREFVGQGEMWLTVGLARDQCEYAHRLPLDLDHDRTYVVGPAAAGLAFSAGTGQKALDRLVPGAGDYIDGESASEEAGVALRAAEHYQFCARMQEEDSLTDNDYMGAIALPLDEASNWGIGTHTMRSSKTAGREDGDYDLSFEIRHTPLPDLRPTDIRVFDETGEACLVARNDGPVASGPFRMSLYVDGAPVQGGSVGPTELASGETNGVCKLIPLPDSGSHRLALVVDEERAVPETDEGNNRLEQGLDSALLRGRRILEGIDVATISPGSDPDPPPSSGDDVILRSADPRAPRIPTQGVIKLPDPDLRVSAIEVISAVDQRCMAGKNAIVVTITPSADGSVGEFKVQATVDDHLIDTATISGMGSNSERKVPMAPLEMKPGKHTVQAIVDSANNVPEEDETNNTRGIEVDCRTR